MATLQDIRKQYPDYADMSDGDLASALHKKFYSDMPRADFDQKIGLSAQPQQPAPPQMGGAERLAKMGASEAGKGALTTYGLPMDVVQGGYNLIGQHVTAPIYNLGRRALGLEPQEYKPVSLPGSSANIQTAARNAGLIDRPELQPQSKGEEYFAMAARGAGGAAPFAPIAGPVALVQGATGGLVMQGGRDALAQTTLKDNPYAKVAVDFGTSLAGGYAGGKVFDATTRAVNAAFGNLDELGQAYQTAGVTPRLTAEASGARSDQRLLAYTSKAPGSANTVQDAAQKTLDEFGAAVERSASRFGQSRTPQQAGDALQKGAQDWLARWKNDSTAAWNGFWKSIPEGAQSNMPNTRGVLSMSGTAMAKEMPDLAKALQDPKIRQLADTVKAETRFPYVDSTAEVTKLAPVSGKTVREFRTAIGEVLDNAPLAGDVNVAGLRRLYAALTEDIKLLAGANGGPKAVEAFEQANTLTRTGHNLIESTVSNIVGSGKRIVSPEQAASWAMTQAGKGGTRVGDVRAAAGDEAMGELASADLRARAAASPGNQNAAGNAVSPDRLVTEFTKLSPEARQVLYGQNKELDAILKVADSMKQAGKLANTSNTGPYNQTGQLVEKMATYPLIGAAGGAGLGMGAGVGAGAGAGAGAITGAAVAGAPYAANYLLGQLSTSKALARALMAKGATPAPASGIAALLAAGSR